MSAATTRAIRPQSVHTRSASVRPAKAAREHTVTRPATTPHVAGAGADQQQAEYFLRLLIHSARQIGHRIDSHQKAIAVSEACGDAEGVRTFRHLARVEEKDRRAVEQLIGNLQRRFPARNAVEAPAVPGAPRTIAR
jgi:hypothetical protein